MNVNAIKESVPNHKVSDILQHAEGVSVLR